MPFETRSGKRYPITANVRFSVDEPMAGGVKLGVPEASVKGVLIDINAQGCGLDSPYLIPPNTMIRLEIDSTLFTEKFKHERRGPIMVTGSVRSCVMKSVGHYRLGVFFKEIKQEDVAFLDNFIKRSQP